MVTFLKPRKTKTEWTAKCVCGHTRVVHTDEGVCMAFHSKPDPSTRTGHQIAEACNCSSFRPWRRPFVCVNPLGDYETHNEEGQSIPVDELERERAHRGPMP